MSHCKIQIIGNLGRDPEMRYLPSGRPVTQFSVAVNQSSKDQKTGEWIEETDWFRVSIFGNQAERMAENLRKGGRVFVDGRFRTREWEAQDGSKRTALEVTADNVVNLERRSREDGEGTFNAPPGDRGDREPPPAGGGRGGGAGGAGGGGGGGGGGPRDDSDLDDLPF